jgi:hypothetical protein
VSPLTLPNGIAEVVAVPRVPGKSYYPQDPPEKRGFRKKTFHLRYDAVTKSFEGDAFDADAKLVGISSVAYLRKLWNDDRQRRGLPPWKPNNDADSEPSK